MEQLLESYGDSDEEEKAPTCEIGIGPQLPEEFLEERESKRQRTSEGPFSHRRGFEVKRYISKREREMMMDTANKTQKTQKHEDINMFELPSIISSLVENPTQQSTQIPQETVATFEGHTNVINCIRWSKPHGQLLASASMDNTVKIWDVFTSKKCVMTVGEHEGAIKDVQWNKDSTQLITASFDKYVNLTDVETATCVQKFKHKEYVTAITYHPTHHSLFLAGGFQKGMVCWDIRSNKVVTKYTGPFGQVFGMEFIDAEGKQFVSSAEVTKKNSLDKAIIVWDFDSAVQLSNQVYLEAFSCPSVRVHPDYKHFVAQSNGGYIAIFSTTPPYKLVKTKRFEGHKVSGNHIHCNISVDGSVVSTGSADGKVHLYNWYSSKTIRVLPAHNKAPCTEAVFHPLLPSVLASCGWDKRIHIFQ